MRARGISDGLSMSRGDALKEWKPSLRAHSFRRVWLLSKRIPAIPGATENSVFGDPQVILKARALIEDRPGRASLPARSLGETPYCLSIQYALMPRLRAGSDGRPGSRRPGSIAKRFYLRRRQLLDVDLYWVCRPAGRREYHVDKLATDERAWKHNVELIQSDKPRRRHCDHGRRRRSADRDADGRLRRGSESGAECDQEDLVRESPEIDLYRVESVACRI